MSDSSKLERVSVVLIGSFNPAIFQPSWFAAHGLIASDEKKVPSGITLRVVHPEIVDFSTENFQIQVIQHRVSISTTDVSFYDSLKDLVVGTFKILSHTPIVKMGVNREFHFQMPTESAWNEVGDRLAPKDDWIRVLDKPGMQGLTVQGDRSDGRKGFVRTRVKPSKQVLPYGVFVEVNDHYEVADPENVQGCSELIDTMADVWAESLVKAERIAQAIVFRAEEGS